MQAIFTDVKITSIQFVRKAKDPNRRSYIKFLVQLAISSNETILRIKLANNQRRNYLVGGSEEGVAANLYVVDEVCRESIADVCNKRTKTVC